MSRHRNIRNLTEDDYYDYDDEDDYYDDEDEYYDDGYTAEENEAYYREQQRLKEEEEETKKKQQQQQILKQKNKQNTAASNKNVTFDYTTTSSSGSSSTKTSTITSSKSQYSEKEQLEKERLVTSMGFSIYQAKEALQRNSWDVQNSINDLLSDSSRDTANAAAVDVDDIKSTGYSSSVPFQTVGFNNEKKVTSKQSFGKISPPPGWTKPSNTSSNISKNTLKNTSKNTSKNHDRLETESQHKSSNVKMSSNNTIITPSSSGKYINNKDSKSKVSDNNILTSKPKIVTNPKKKLSKDLQMQIKGQKSRLSMVILGHVDAGKSTLMGQVLVQGGVVQKRIIAKYQKEAAQIGKASFALAWVMDEDDSERERGVTIDVATKYITTEKHELTILDSPGHADFVPAMITGAASADVGILVIAATPGEFESGFNDKCSAGVAKGHVGQTREHITLARGLGVSQLIVAINKLDAAEPSWSQDRFIEIRKRLIPFLKGNGFDMKRVQFVPISGLTGVNVKISPSNDDNVGAELASWYHDRTLFQAINSFEPAKRNVDKPFRFLIADVYSEGKYVIVKGRVVQGYLSVGDKVAVLPVGDVADVGRIEHGIATSSELDGERINVVVAGDSAELFLTGIDIARIGVGNVISDVDESLRPKLRRKMKAKIMIVDRLNVPIIQGSQVLFYMHSLDIPAIINRIDSSINRMDGSINERPRMLTGRTNASVEIKLSEKICLETFNECKPLGRFALRRSGDTVAVGIVESLD